MLQQNQKAPVLAGQRQLRTDLLLDARNLPTNRLLFPELYEHPRYRAMLRKHRLDDESIAQLKVSSLSF